MKTLLININKEPHPNNGDLIVLDYDLDGDYFYLLGGKIAKGCEIENVIRLITDFDTLDNQDDYRLIIAQWHKVKTILFSEQCVGEYQIKLPQNYLRWMRFHPQYVSIYDRNFSHGESAIIKIDLEELYEMSIKRLQNRILLKIYRNQEIDGFVFNDDAVTRVSPIVRAIKEKHQQIGFKSYIKWRQMHEISYNEPEMCSKQEDAEAPRSDLFEQAAWGWQTVRYFDSSLILKRHHFKYGLVDNDGRVILPCEYNEIQVLKSKYIRLCKDGKYGIINNNGTTNIPCIYDAIQDCEDGLFVVREGEHSFKIDCKGIKRYLKQGKFWLCINEDGCVNPDWMRIVSPAPNMILGQSELSILEKNVEFLTITQNGHEQMKAYMYKVKGNMDVTVIQLINDSNISKIIISSATEEYNKVKAAVQRLCQTPILKSGGKLIYQTFDKVLKILITETLIFIEHNKTSATILDTYYM